MHRDIKPGNLVITTDGRTVKILDLGLAHLYTKAGDTVDSLTNSEDIWGRRVT